MKAVHKFPLLVGTAKPIDSQELAVAMPRGATILSVGVQVSAGLELGAAGPRSVFVETIAIWALVDPAAEPVTRRFVILQTGEQVDEKRLAGTRFVATALGVHGHNVTHVFEVETAVPDGVA